MFQTPQNISNQAVGNNYQPYLKNQIVFEPLSAMSNFRLFCFLRRACCDVTTFQSQSAEYRQIPDLNFNLEVDLGLNLRLNVV